MDKYKITFDTWNKIAQIYEDKFMDLDLYNHSYDLFIELLSQENASILELGSGPGNITKYLLNKRPDFQILGLDVAPNMIALAKKNNPSAKFRVMDCRKIDQLKSKFDGIIAGFCLPYLSESDAEKLIKDAAKLLNQHGILYLSFVAGDYLESDFKSGSSGDQVFFYFHDLEAIRKKLLENNFEMLKLFHVKYPRNNADDEQHSILILIKK